MNHYPKWWNRKITLYNKYKDPNTNLIIWYPTKIDGAFYSRDNVKLEIGQTILQSDSTICRIRVDDKFLTPTDWMKLSDAERELYFTLRPGDLIVNDWVDFIADEQTKGQRASDLLKEYKDWPGCFTVQTVSINVGGRGNEHYLARGV